MLRTPVPLLLLLSLVLPLSAADKLKPEEIVKRHLDGQLAGGGEKGERARLVRGSCTVTTPAGVAGVLAGTFALSSSTQGSRLIIQFPSDNYPGETFTVAGGQVDIGFAQPRTNSRSALGIFLAMNRVVVAEGLLGGALNARWPLINAADRQVTLSYDGTKKFGGREAHRLRYRAKRGQGELEIFFFFDPETFRHVGSTYTYSQAQSMGFRPEASSQNTETYFHLDETFSDFEQFGDLTLPKSWTVRYARSGDTTAEWKYQFNVLSTGEPDARPAYLLFQ